MARTKATDSKLPDGEYIAKCRQKTVLSAAANGHSQVFPEAHLVVKGGTAYFSKEGKKVWSCNVTYAAAHFDVTALSPAVKTQAKPKLTQAQARVMKWLSQKWSARVSHGSAVEINGQRVCNVDTMTALERLGLVKRELSGYWEATPEGRKFSPNYQEPEQETPQ